MSPEPTTTSPLYVRVLRLHHLDLRGWQRGLLSEGVLVASVLLVLADLVSAWGLVVLPLAVAAVVKANDAVAGRLARTARDAPAPGQLPD